MKIISSSYFIHVQLLKKEVIPGPALAGEWRVQGGGSEKMRGVWGRLEEP